jgi:hypothetical protein
VSVISSALASALSAIATAKGEVLSYATAHGQSFTALTGFVIHQDRVGEPTHDDQGRVVSQVRRAVLKGPVSPLMAKGYEIKDSKPTTPIVWAVEGVKIEEQQIVTLMREERVGPYGPDRGASA